MLVERAEDEVPQPLIAEEALLESLSACLGCGDDQVLKARRPAAAERGLVERKTPIKPMVATRSSSVTQISTVSSMVWISSSGT